MEERTQAVSQYELIKELLGQLVVRYLEPALRDLDEEADQKRKGKRPRRRSRRSNGSHGAMGERFGVRSGIMIVM